MSCLQGGLPRTNDKDKAGTNVRTTFNLCADKEVDIVVGPGGYITNKQFYPMKVFVRSICVVVGCVA